ncbi:MAG: GIY-YIG nuclease family protein [Candidatus Krumholzibacteriota bacterium]|nr:GIY-YIG nuclease family protein [Candidatus Krumholzibacteriota bacterium]
MPKNTENQWHVYIVRCADGTLYTGIAREAEARVSQHNAGNGARYTRTRRPVELVYREVVRDRGAAQRREHEIKRMNTPSKRALIADSDTGRASSPACSNETPETRESRA